MPRWEPNAQQRLQEAASELFAERGYDNTTVVEIAERAGLTERTFFRNFEYKREVLFYGEELLQEAMTGALDDAPAEMTAMEAVMAALTATAEAFFEQRRPFVARRQAIIDANPELQERELSKLASLAKALAEGLRRRGIDDTAADIVAETGVTMFKVAFDRWLRAEPQLSLEEAINSCFAQLRSEAAKRRRRVRSRSLSG